MEKSAEDTVVAIMDKVVVKYRQYKIQQVYVETCNEASTQSIIYGNLTDYQGRCTHYHSPLDVIANKCSVCRKFYSCYKCHNEKESHSFGSIPPEEASSVMCGVCGLQFSYSEYEQMGGSCKNCGANFNPRCSLHKCIYSD